MIWWLIRILFFTAFVMLEIKLAKGKNGFVGIIPPFCAACVSVLIYLAIENKMSFFGIAMDNVISFGVIAILLLVVYFYCRFQRKGEIDENIS